MSGASKFLQNAGGAAHLGCAVAPTNMRRSFDGLAGIHLGEAPSGDRTARSWKRQSATRPSSWMEFLDEDRGSRSPNTHGASALETKRVSSYT